MRTIRTKIYQFNELKDSAKEFAINKERENVFIDFIYDEAYKTVKLFNQLFEISEGRLSWLDCNTSKINDSILELKGLRLQKYILNNYGNTLFKNKYLKHGNLREKKIGFFHPMVKIKEINQGPNKGLFSYSYYSNIKKENASVLTGIYYDDSILQPIYEFLLKRDFSNCTINFYDLLNDCFKELTETIEKEVEYRQSDEAIIEDITEQNLEFTSNGQRFF